MFSLIPTRIKAYVFEVQHRPENAAGWQIKRPQADPAARNDLFCDTGEICNDVELEDRDEIEIIRLNRS